MFFLFLVSFVSFVLLFFFLSFCPLCLCSFLFVVPFVPLVFMFFLFVMPFVLMFFLFVVSFVLMFFSFRSALRVLCVYCFFPSHHSFCCRNNLRQRQSTGIHQGVQVAAGGTESVVNPNTLDGNGMI